MTTFLRRASSLVISFDSGFPKLLNYATRTEVACDALLFELISRLGVWCDAAWLAGSVPGAAPAVVADRINQLAARGFVLALGTAAEAADAQLAREWQWGAVAGLYHFSMKNLQWLNPAQSAQTIALRERAQPAISLWRTHGPEARVTPLPAADRTGEFHALVAGRRSVRQYTPQPVTREAIADCLYCGLGITKFLDTGLPGSARIVPLKTTPSGGGRNPYEGFLYALRVEGLAPGVYHYSGVQHNLELVNARPAVGPEALLAGQDWAAGAAAVILLAADFRRTMWKYGHPTGYRVVLIEAGHIGQNIMLAATRHQLSAAPTAAIADGAAESLLGLHSPGQSVVYALVIGHPDKNAPEYKLQLERPQPRGPASGGAAPPLS